MNRCWITVLVLLSGASLLGATLPAGPSLAAAIARAHAGDTIVLEGPRAYRGPVVVDKPICLQGTNWPAIDGGRSGTVMVIKAPNVEIRDLIVRDGGTNLADFDTGIRVDAPGAIIRDCRVETPGFGIYLHGASRCRVEGNRILGDTRRLPVQRGNGIHLWKTAHNLIRSNVIERTRDGIYLSYADHNRIIGNQIRETRFGIHYMYSHYNELYGNRLDDNVVGAALMFARNCRVEDNFAVHNRRHGILLMQVEHSQIRRNVVDGQNRGFYVQQAVQDRFEQNVIADNDIGVYMTDGSEDNRFTGNAFLDNAQQVWQPPETIHFVGREPNLFSKSRHGNYWSDYTGADDDGDGIGDVPYHETDLFGYLTDRYPEVRVLALSPAVALLRRSEKALPVLNAGGVKDPFPLATEPRSLARLLSLALEANPPPPSVQGRVDALAQTGGRNP